MTTVNQPTSRPTNKAMAATFGSVVGVYLAPAIGSVFTATAATVLPPLATPEVEILIEGFVGAGLALLPAYYVKDRPNVAA